MQCPTLVRLPPGVRFSDDGALERRGALRPASRGGLQGRVRRGEHGGDWDDPEVGIVRLEIAYSSSRATSRRVEFDVEAFTARAGSGSRGGKPVCSATSADAWEGWEQGELRQPRDLRPDVCAQLGRLRDLLERHPRLDGGRWWGWLGGFHMNVHKLLENTLFECELYLGYALTFGDAEVRQAGGAEPRRLLQEAAPRGGALHVDPDGLEQMMRGEWVTAAETLQSRRGQAGRLGLGGELRRHLARRGGRAPRARCATLLARDGADDREGARWIAEAAQLLERGCGEGGRERGYFGPEGHPWAVRGWRSPQLRFAGLQEQRRRHGRVARVVLKSADRLLVCAGARRGGALPAQTATSARRRGRAGGTPARTQRLK